MHSTHRGKRIDRASKRFTTKTRQSFKGFSLYPPGLVAFTMTRVGETNTFIRANAMRSSRILVVDDNQAFLTLAVGMLREVEGIEVVGSAATGRQAIECADVLKPDLVLMDISMPEMTGLDATRFLAVQPEAPPIILMTNHPAEMYRRAAINAGAREFLRKSDFATLLVPLIRSVLAAPDHVPLKLSECAGSPELSS